MFSMRYGFKGLFYSLLLSNSYAGVTLIPVILTVNPQETITTLEVINTGKASLSYQLDVHEWDKQALGKIGEKDQSWIISPKIITIAPGKSQLVRLATKSPNTSEIELTKRLMLRQIKKKTSESDAISIQTNMSLPIFIEGLVRTQEKPLVVSTGNTLIIKNPNTHHMSLGALKYKDKTINVGGYILANKQKTVNLPFTPTKGLCHLNYELYGKIQTLDF